MWKQYEHAVDDMISQLMKAIENTRTGDSSGDDAIMMMVYRDFVDDPKATREKLAGLLTVAGMRMARALHEGDWA